MLAAGYPVIGYDLDAARLAEAVASGATAGTSVVDVVRQAEVIATSLPSSSAWVQLAEHEILPHVRAGQIVIDFGTVTPPEARRLATCFAEKGVEVLDVPVSGGGGGAQQARLYMFVGGKQETVASCLPILHTIGGKERLTYCGPAGNGQIVKGVNQLMMGLVDAAILEAISFGVNCGVEIHTIQQAIGHEGRYRADFNRTAQRIADGQGNQVGVKFRELPYFLEAAQAEGIELPMTNVVREYCDKGERIVIDDHRQAPSYWHELTHR